MSRCDGGSGGGGDDDDDDNNDDDSASAGGCGVALPTTHRADVRMPTREWDACAPISTTTTTNDDDNHDDDENDPDQDDDQDDATTVTDCHECYSPLLLPGVPTQLPTRQTGIR